MIEKIEISPSDKAKCKRCDKTIGKGTPRGIKRARQLDDYGNEEDIDEILNPNCSEEVFKLSGDVADIKKEVLQMLNIIEQEDDNNISHEDLRKKIENINNLEEFEDIVFEFTCNYETFFKVDKSTDELLVATSNNYEWDTINNNPELTRGYYDIAHYDYYKVVYIDNSFFVVEKEYAEKEEKGKFLFFDRLKGINWKIREQIQLRKTQRNYFIVENNSLLPLVAIKDKLIQDRIKIIINL